MIPRYFINGLSMGKVTGSIILVLIFSISGCGAIRKTILPENEVECECMIPEPEMTMTIKWQRLLSEGETCPRCGSTEEELDKAVIILDQALAAMGIKVVLEKDSLSAQEFDKDPLRSNRILINDRPLEDYIAAKTGQSPCCDECGSADCRTVEVEGETYETIPSALIVQAGLIAASRMVAPQEKAPCCREE